MQCFQRVVIFEKSKENGKKEKKKIINSQCLYGYKPFKLISIVFVQFFILFYIACTLYSTYPLEKASLSLDRETCWLYLITPLSI